MPRITIMVPTYGKREQWLDLQKRYYGNPQDIQIIICRGGVNFCDGISQYLDQIKSPYAVFCGDDDFQDLNTLRRFADYLDAQPDVAGVYGDGLLMGLNGFQVQWSAKYDLGVERIFALLRTEAFKDCFLHGRLARSNRGFYRGNLENAARYFTARSKLHRIDYKPGLQLIRGHHSERGVPENRTPSREFLETYFGWLTSWLPSRSGSIRALNREWHPFHLQFVKFQEFLDAYVESQNVDTERLQGLLR